MRRFMCKQLKKYVALMMTMAMILLSVITNPVVTQAEQGATPMDAVQQESAVSTEEYIDEQGTNIKDAPSGNPSISYAVHCQNYGWMAPVSDGKQAGTTGQAKRLEAICIELKSNGVADDEGNSITGGVRYRTHVQNIGWQDWVTSNMDEDSVNNMIDGGKYAGTSGMARRIEAIQIELTGDLANYYDVVYRTHVQHYGWLEMVKNGAISGTTGQAKRMETIEIALVRKNQSTSATITYRAHSQNYGWGQEITPALGEYNSSTIAGTIGKGKRLEAIEISIETKGVSGGIEYQTHVQNHGWMGYVNNGALSGTTGEAKRIEAISINLTGPIAAHYDVYYRAHVQNLGWLDWARNGQNAGTQGVRRRMEAIQILLVEKGAPAPGSTNRPFYNCSNGNYGILPGAYSIRVNKQMNCITIYKGSIPVKAMVCSTGDFTPVGTFDLKKKWRWKELIHDVYGQYSCHITGNILFHSVPYDDPNNRTLLTNEYNKLGQTASAGCIRLTTADAKWLHDNCPIGTPVVIYNSADPGPLGKPTAQKLPAGQKWDPTDPEFSK